MIKSILAMFGSLGGMILRVMLTIASLVGVFYLGFTAFRVEFRWGGALRLLGAVVCAAVFMILVTLRKKDDADDASGEKDRFS